MSMNFNIAASIDAYDKFGNKNVIFKPIFLWQTPTEVSYEIMEQEDKLEAYCQWIIKTDLLDTIGEYTGTPEEIWNKEFNAAEYDRFYYYSGGYIHAKKVKEEIQDYISRGFEIRYYIQ